MSSLGKSLTCPIPREAVPHHVAIIMDGNGRWAKNQGRARVFGHKHGAERVREIVEQSGQWGVKYLTLYAFSDENWGRPAEEVGVIMNLLDLYLRKECQDLNRQNVKLEIIGDLSKMAPKLRELILATRKTLAGNTGLTLNLALSYGARSELTRAMRSISEKVLAGTLAVDAIDPAIIAEHLDTKGIPDPDLVIRTSGEQRISNFLLWQCAYSEFYFTQVLWPDFSRSELGKALLSFYERERRFGLTSAQAVGCERSHLIANGQGMVSC